MRRLTSANPERCSLSHGFKLQKESVSTGKIDDAREHVWAEALMLN